MPSLTKSELDDLIQKRVDATLKEASEKTARELAEKEKADEKAANAAAAKKEDVRKQFEELRLEAEQKAERYGHAIEKPEVKFAKLITIFASAGGDVSKMPAVANKLYADDAETKSYIAKALEAGTPSAGGFGIPSVLSSRTVEALYAMAILPKLGVSGIPLVNGNLEFMRMSASASVGWVGELPSTGTTQPAYNTVKLTSKKLFALAELSNTLLRNNVVGIESWLVRDLQKKFRIALDSALLYGAGTEYTPLGLSGQGVQTLGSSSTALLQTHPDAMVALLKAANVPMTNLHWIMSPQMETWLKGLITTTGAWIFRQEMIASEKLAGIPYHVSTSVSYTGGGTPYSDLWLGDFDELLWGVGMDIELRMSQEASFVDGGVTYSAFQRDSSLVRVIGEHDFNVMHPVSFVRGTFTA